MPRRTKKKAPTKRKGPAQYRPKMSRQIQMANQKPASCMVRFQGKMKYQCLFQSAANNKSILRVPASFIGDPVIETGTWTPDSASRFVDTTTNFFGKYNHYKVLGARLVVSVKTLLADPSQQNNCMVFVARVTNTNVYTISTALKDLEDDYAVKSKQWGSYASTAYRQARTSIGYSPKKQLNLKDIQDNGTIKVSTASYGLTASDNTFFNVILSGELDSVTSGHSSAIVDVKCSYLCAFEEPKSTENAPTII